MIRIMTRLVLLAGLACIMALPADAQLAPRNDPQRLVHYNDTCRTCSPACGCAQPVKRTGRKHGKLHPVR